MLEKNFGRILLSCALTLSYAWTACQKREMKLEARQAPSEIKIEAKNMQANQPIFAEAFSEIRQAEKY